MKIVDLHNYRGPHTYCGRAMPGRPGSPLANPFKVKEHGSRTLELYREHLATRIKAGDRAILDALRCLTDESILGCWCVDLTGDAVFAEPTACHCQIIARAWRWLQANPQSPIVAPRPACLSLWQPWATLLAAGKKMVETRSWPHRFRGKLLIHASKKWRPELHALCLTEPFRSALTSIGFAQHSGNWKLTNLPLGAIVGRVNVAQCFHSEVVTVAASNPAETRVTEWSIAGGADNESLHISETEAAFGDYTPGRFAYLCRDAELFAQPVPCSGHQGFFLAPHELVSQFPEVIHA